MSWLLTWYSGNTEMKMFSRHSPSGLLEDGIVDGVNTSSAHLSIARLDAFSADPAYYIFLKMHSVI